MEDHSVQLGRLCNETVDRYTDPATWVPSREGALHRAAGSSAATSKLAPVGVSGRI
jgi:hypothetical protein